jgi:serine-type D-Ala-D-Ala carboxypeptidase/endopeptidase (penicillin-binding protein 4)
MTPLQAALERWLHQAGSQSGALVYDLSAHTTLFALRAGVTRPPASVQKLYTTVALARELGPEATLQTTVLGTGHLGPGGVWHGDLYLRGGGDPTLGDGTFNQAWELGYGPTAGELVQQLIAHGIRRVTGRVIGDESLFDSMRGGPASGFAPDIGDYGGQLSALTYDHGATSGALSPAAFAAKELVLTMRAAHLRARAASMTAVTPPGATALGTVSSPPLSILLKLMDVPSDDLFAELLTKQLGVKSAGSGTTVAGTGVIASVLGGYGVHPRIVDGSGLSRSNSSSPGQVVALLRAVWHTPVGAMLSASLPVVGVSGTVRALAIHTPAQGHCAAKTGTLNNVTNLAGYCVSRQGHVLAFAVFIDGPANGVAMGLLGRMVASIASDQIPASSR